VHGRALITSMFTIEESIKLFPRNQNKASNLWVCVCVREREALIV
jgi:hypothetical protein